MAANAETTGSHAFFSEQVATLQRRLEGDESPRARELATEATRLAAMFESGLEPEAKAAAIRELVDLNRAIHEHAGVMSGVRRVPASE
jgi:hypothetical protein